MNKLSYLLFCIAMLISSASASQVVNSQNVVNRIELYLDGSNIGDNILLSVVNDSKVDSIYTFTVAGRIGFTTTLHDVYVKITYFEKDKRRSNQNYKLYVRSGKEYKLVGTTADMKNAVASGDLYDFEEFRRIHRGQLTLDSLNRSLARLKEIPNSGNMVVKIGNDIKNINKKMVEDKSAFVRKYNNNDYSVVILTDLLSGFDNKDNNLTIDSIHKMYSNLTAELRNSSLGIPLGRKLEFLNGSSVGAVIPDFTLTSTEGKKVSPKDFRGKWLLLDFWGSWCRPHRMNISSLIEIYDKYHDKGLEVVGITCWDNEDKWLAAIEEDGLKWIHVNSDEQVDGQESVRELFGIHSVPRVVLVDPKGIIRYAGHPVMLPQEIAKAFGN